ncbi:hypothetical protein ABZ897_38835 [Nonomuraea sp. NPDC046802]|uniref:hypothetical protein n=1 Tax=Nonomuraea sp. NPDC046802 TaxID=3154919 RepID=UPI0033EBAA55
MAAIYRTRLRNVAFDTHSVVTSHSLWTLSDEGFDLVSEGVREALCTLDADHGR